MWQDSYLKFQSTNFIELSNLLPAGSRRGFKLSEVGRRLNSPIPSDVNHDHSMKISTWALIISETSYLGVNAV